MRTDSVDTHTIKFDMGQSAGYKESLSIPPFWQKASAELPNEWPKCIAMMKMTVVAKNGIDIRVLLHPKPPINDTSEPIYELEINAKQKQKTEN